MTRLINFTKGEAAALLHRLEAGTLAEVLTEETAGMYPPPDRIDARCAELARDLKTRSPFVVLHSEHEITARTLDRLILLECVEGSTWVAVHDTPTNRQAYTAARRTLHRIADKLSLAFDILVTDIEIPGA